MDQLYTKNGKPLTVSGDNIFDRSRRHVGRRRGDKVYAWGALIRSSCKSAGIRYAASLCCNALAAIPCAKPPEWSPPAVLGSERWVEGVSYGNRRRFR